MQSSLRRYVEPKTGGKQPPQAEQQQQQHAGAAKLKPKGRSMLLAGLTSQLVRGGIAAGGGRGGGSTPATNLPPAAAARDPQPDSAQCTAAAPSSMPLHELPIDVQAAAPQREQQQQQLKPPACLSAAVDSPSLQSCPLGGQLLPVGRLLEKHVEQELLALEKEEAVQQGGEAEWSDSRQQPLAPELVAAATGGDGWPLGAKQQAPHQRQQQQRQKQMQQRQQSREQQRRPTPLPQQAQVLVLGGAPQLTAPIERRRLQQLQCQVLLPAKRQRQQAAAASHNFYNDGSGTMAGEDLGLDGAEHAGICWEGMGISDF